MSLQNLLPGERKINVDLVEKLRVIEMDAEIGELKCLRVLIIIHSLSHLSRLRRVTV